MQILPKIFTGDYSTPSLQGDVDAVPSTGGVMSRTVADALHVIGVVGMFAASSAVVGVIVGTLPVAATGLAIAAAGFAASIASLFASNTITKHLEDEKAALQSRGASDKVVTINNVNLQQTIDHEVESKFTAMIERERELARVSARQLH
jgi:hypothetical protein